jgi:hypothetical protein
MVILTKESPEAKHGFFAKGEWTSKWVAPGHMSISKQKSMDDLPN